MIYGLAEDRKEKGERRKMKGERLCGRIINFVKKL